jgi:hypothetical protein
MVVWAFKNSRDFIYKRTIQFQVVIMVPDIPLRVAKISGKYGFLQAAVLTPLSRKVSKQIWNI